ncbi:paraquat-inducible protein A [Citreimonas salinaria]|uniref:Paraquat-inducible protein A n=1 Tax=Citreimonas salinaria TaxID=321339 RepID=A0A1H3H4J4_9RHOB|nr:paraquat-inducible protein A [Citreimonas salinaria]SDY10240.1 paraquat-inducible protein A [Citreimonas salinaria]
MQPPSAPASNDRGAATPTAGGVLPVDPPEGLPPPEDLIACPGCDALYVAQMPEPTGRAVCERCHRVLIAPRLDAGLRIIALTLAITILVTAAVFFPFLQIEAAGMGNRASIMDVATSFRSGVLVLVSVATIAVIVLVPLMRTLLLLYVLVPLTAGRRPARHARGAFRLAQEMKPWAMTEIFAIGCAVALVKVASLAHLEFGAAFWMFAVLVIIVIANDIYMCSWSIWKSIEDAE